MRRYLVQLQLGLAISFQLSPDRKYIAYWMGKDLTIYAGKQQGNNILNEMSVNQGAVPSWITWSPDNSRLVVDGQKPYVREIRPASVTAAFQAAYIEPFIIEFQ